MNKTQDNNTLPAWSVKVSGGHAVNLLPCSCCPATSLEVVTDDSSVECHVHDVAGLESLRDAITAAIEYHRGRQSPVGEAEDDDEAIHPRRWVGHAPAGVRLAFDRWMDLWPAAAEPGVGATIFRDGLLPSLSDCTDPLPESHRHTLSLPAGTTYAGAVEKLTTLVA